MPMLEFYGVVYMTSKPKDLFTNFSKGTIRKIVGFYDCDVLKESI